ncbi:MULTISPECIES: excisionase [Comamonas]|uniref:excisionase n=1 Tax=Comamonas TaxID=283 RepID=UPI00257EAF67|nr:MULTISPECIES: excisionase [Comamonas]
MKHHDTASKNATPETRVSIEPEWVLASKYQELTGTTPNAVHQRRKEGVWLDGTHCAVIARRLYVNVKEADKWIRNQVSQRQRAY